MENTLRPEKIFVQAIQADWLIKSNARLDILRLDELHPVISGNKWFKLKHYLLDAKDKNCNTIATFGGAFSNHIIATACCCHEEGLKSVGIIRGERPTRLSHTLLKAQQYGMYLQFIDRTRYRDHQAIQNELKDVYWIPEGGYGEPGIKGAGEILSFCKQPQQYTHIVCAVGTGTMMAGITRSVNSSQSVVGISVFKNNYGLHERVEALLSNTGEHKLHKILHDYHFGGYAKHPAELIQFMNDTWQQHYLPTDIVYTAKTFFGVRDMIIKNTIPKSGNVLMIHSGGLQGNLSLPAKTLCF